MAITNSRQNWEVGNIVKVGFLSLLITGFEKTPGDYRPDIYHMQSSKGTRYIFTPHFGLKAVA